MTDADSSTITFFAIHFNKRNQIHLQIQFSPKKCLKFEYMPYPTNRFNVLDHNVLLFLKNKSDMFVVDL